MPGVQLAQHVIHTIMKVIIDTVMLLIYAGVKIMRFYQTLEQNWRGAPGTKSNVILAFVSTFKVMRFLTIQE